MSQYMQTILFGSPGTGKSFAIDTYILPKKLGIDTPENCIKTVFHPEYTYGDFVGKLLPITKGEKVTYRYYEGHFLRALAQAYKNIRDTGNSKNEVKNVALVIDEINRGNSAAIFGTIFQLLDREDDGWSNYMIDISEMEFDRLIDIVFGQEIEEFIGQMTTRESKNLTSIERKQKALEAKTKNTPLDFLSEQKIKIPPNLSILATMNTSDESIFYMDSAFKRRWEWEYISIDEGYAYDVDDDAAEEEAEELAFDNRDEWKAFVRELNKFIKSKHRFIRKIEDKQVGYYFIKDEQITKRQIQNKLMFFIWDTVFQRNKRPLMDLLGIEDENEELVTFGDFTSQIDKFLSKVYEDYEAPSPTENEEEEYPFASSYESPSSEEPSEDIPF